MKEIVLKPGLTVAEMAETFRNSAKEIIPGNWTFVGVKFYFVEETTYIMASPGIYSKDFDAETYEKEEAE